GLALRQQELDGASLPLPLLAESQLGLKALHVQLLAVSLAIEELVESVEHLVRPGDVGLTLAPIRAEALEVVRAHAAVLAGELLVRRDSLPTVRRSTRPGTEVHPVAWARGGQGGAFLAWVVWFRLSRLAIVGRNSP